MRGGSRWRERAMVTMATTLILGACQGVETGVDWHFERMVVQPKYLAYEPSELFADGRAMRTPPGGTVPRGGEPGGGAAGGAEGGAESGGFPIPVTLELLELGRKHFDITCAACHGVAGDGASAVAMKMQLRRPPSLHQAEIRGYSLERHYRVITEGYGLMPSYASLLSWEERWAVVAYLQALQLSQRAVVGELPEPVRGEVEALLGGGRR